MIGCQLLHVATRWLADSHRWAMSKTLHSSFITDPRELFLEFHPTEKGLNDKINTWGGASQHWILIIYRLWTDLDAKSATLLLEEEEEVLLMQFHTAALVRLASPQYSYIHCAAHKYCTKIKCAFFDRKDVLSASVRGTHKAAFNDIYS